MSKLSVSFWRETSAFAPGLCALVATLGLATAVNAGGEANCPNVNGGDCFTETLGTGGCQDGTCCNLVCDTEPFCCQVEWDASCVAIAESVCEQPCDGDQLAYSNVTTLVGGTSSSQGAMITADDIFPVSGGVVTEISFSVANFNLAAPNGPTGELTNGVLTMFLIDGTGSFTAPVVPDDVFAEIEIDLTGLFDGSEVGADPLPPDTFVVLTLTFTPEDGLIIPPGFFWAGLRPDSAVFQNTPAGGNNSVNHVGQALFNPVDVGGSNDVFWRQNFGLAFFGGNPVANFAWEFKVACGPGACCNPVDGSCSFVEEMECTDGGGIFVGPGIQCADVNCPVQGACCLVGGTCVDGLFEGECEADFGGTWQGPQTVCGSVSCPAPCNQACTGTSEGEVCGTSSNDGCNSENQNEFGAIACGATVCGTAWADGGTRDTDWYLLTVPSGAGQTAFTVTLSSEFPADSFIVDVADCNAISLPDPDNNGVNVSGCTADSYTVCVDNGGTYAVFVGAATAGGALFDGVPCGGGANDYRLMVTCAPCGGGPTCPPDTVTSATFLPPADGIVDGADLAVLLGDWSPSPCGASCATDTVTSATFQPPPDGVVDGADLAVLLGAWGNPGCPNGFP